MKSSKTWVIIAVLAIAGILIFTLVNKQQQDRENALTAIRNNWSSFVYLREYRYQYSAFGGVQPFDISAQNSTDYFIDQIIVSVRYVKASGGIWKTENVAITNIPPHTLKTGRVPASPRGTSVDATITEVTSRSLQFCYPGSMLFPNDPYLCK